MATDSVHAVRAARRLHAQGSGARVALGRTVGFVITGIKELGAAKVGDTVTHAGGAAGPSADKPLPGFKEIKPSVFAGLYPIEANQYDALRDALEKLSSTTRRCTSSPRSPRRWGSASAAASSGCFTWTSSRSGSSVNTRWS